MRSEIKNTIITIIHRDGPMPYDDLVMKLSLGISTSEAKQSIDHMLDGGHLLHPNGNICLSEALEYVAESMEDARVRKSKIEVTPSRQNFSHGVFDGSMYANVMHRLRADVSHISVGNSNVPFHVMDK